MDKYRVILEGSKISDYYEFEKVLKKNGIDASVINAESKGDEMGLAFEGLVILLPLLTPAFIQFRKALKSYFDYKKSQRKRISVTLEKNGKKLKIEAENEDIPDVSAFMRFFADVGDEHQDTI